MAAAEAMESISEKEEVVEAPSEEDVEAPAEEEEVLLKKKNLQKKNLAKLKHH